MAANNELPQMFSPYEIIANADAVVQSVVGILVLVSLITWTVIIGRAWLLVAENKRMRELDKACSSAAAFDKMVSACDVPDAPVGRIIQAISSEYEHAVDGRQSYPQVRDRLVSAYELAIGKEVDKIAGRVTLLATFGSTAPFIGLFGTVWGIMASFISIGQTQDTSLSVVAPGIAEALMATAIGLFCAIPAVIAYNRLSQSILAAETSWRRVAMQAEILISREYTSGAK